MWNIAVPVWELIVRAGAVYAFLLVLLRLTGKRQNDDLWPPLDESFELLEGVAVRRAAWSGPSPPIVPP